MRRADRLALGVAALGGLVSFYLTWLHYSGSLALCLGAGGCETVQSSRYAELGGIPVALLGLVFFVLAAGLVVRRDRMRGARREAARLAFFGLTLSGVVFAGYLTYLELFVIGAICPWCVTVALCVALLFALAVRDLGTKGSIP